MSLIKWLACLACAGISGVAVAAGQVIEVSVFDRTANRTLPIHRHDGRYFVVGHPGHEYRIRVRNRSADDILAVVSVDGVNAVTGETAGWSQGGYVLGARQGYDIVGWRKSLQKVAAFYFAQHEDSYAVRTGRPENTGVIGIAAFRRKAEPMASIAREQAVETEAASRAEASSGLPAPTGTDTLADERSGPALGSGERHGSPRAPREQKLGTGHGRREHSPVTYTEFERASRVPDEVVVIRYDTYHNLVAQGVIRPPRVAEPTPFPGQFAPDPR